MLERRIFFVHLVFRSIFLKNTREIDEAFYFIVKKELLLHGKKMLNSKFVCVCVCVCVRIMGYILSCNIKNNRARLSYRAIFSRAK